ncbi:unnamed protein product [Absidia cylindrospora]
MHVLEDKNVTLDDQQKRNFHYTGAHLAGLKNEDPYSILGVPKSANQGDIKKAYYTLAKKYHPDTNKDKFAHGKFAQVQEAYEILSDKQKRAHYDQFGNGFGDRKAGFGTDGFYGRTGGKQEFTGGFDPNDIFFGGGGAGQRFHHAPGASMGGMGSMGGRKGFRSMTGENLQTPLTITFMEAVKGAKKDVCIHQVTNCSSCEGSGIKSGTSLHTCKVCHGSGMQTMKVGDMNMPSSCAACGGAGKSIPSGGECGTCDGIGKVRERKFIQIDIPPGVDNKARIRVAGQGDAPLKGDGPHGDLFVSLNIEPSKIFRRQDKDIFLDAAIPFYKAILGGKVKVPTVDGMVELKIPEGTQVDDKISLKGRGIQQLRGAAPGDQIVTLKVELPRPLDDDYQYSIMRKYAELVDPDYNGTKN